uniref:Putative group viii salivary lipocalin n=1 Tax=Rhipicephalus pulchellus TaxID=72859 RepID=L7M9G6_RHIPC
MTPWLFGLLSACTFAFVVTYGVENAETQRHNYTLPLKSNKTLYLAGHSTQLDNPSIRCVYATYINSSGESVNRDLWFTEIDVEGEGISDEEWGIPLNMKVNDTPTFSTLEVEVTWFLTRYTQAQHSYKIINYSDEVMVLGERQPSESDKPYCSVWVTDAHNNLTHVSPAINASIYSDCDNIITYPYLRNCSLELG